MKSDSSEKLCVGRRENTDQCIEFPWHFIYNVRKKKETAETRKLFIIDNYSTCKDIGTLFYITLKRCSVSPV